MITSSLLRTIIEGRWRGKDKRKNEVIGLDNVGGFTASWRIESDNVTNGNIGRMIMPGKAREPKEEFKHFWWDCNKMVICCGSENKNWKCSYPVLLCYGILKQWMYFLKILSTKGLFIKDVRRDGEGVWSNADRGRGKGPCGGLQAGTFYCFSMQTLPMCDAY